MKTFKNIERMIGDMNRQHRIAHQAVAGLAKFRPAFSRFYPVSDRMARDIDAIARRDREYRAFMKRFYG